MARKRMIDPQFWCDEKMMTLSHSARLLFIGLWNFCDDSGIHKDSDLKLKAEIFPADDITKDEGFFGISNNLLEKGYGILITKPSNYLNRDPLFRYAFYDNAKDLIKFMDEPTKTKFIKESEVYIDCNKLWD